MKMRNFGIVMISVLILLGSCFTAAATGISDGTGDVWHWAQSGTAWSWVGNVGNKPNIDITEVAYTVNGNKITLSLKVSGTIQTSDKIVYWVYYNSTDTTYWLSYSNGTGVGYGMKGGTFNFTSADNVTVSGNTLSVVLDVLGDTSTVELWGYAFEYTTTFGDQTNEWWGDWAPNSKLPFTPPTGGTTDGNTTGGNTTGGNSTGGGTKTPGFEVIPVIAAVGIAAILLRRRR
ncbi:MAG TPA: hypothetical protein DSN98_06155 [Thermoplasmata archaeon]|jgi:hypothetical protein|nr:MAG TPA: hypothetical protein DSN98_06155 [Thermoplasmata archaeon]